MTTAQRNASAYIATTSDDKIEAVVDYGTCADCGKPLESHEFTRCTRCVNELGDDVLIANSITWTIQEASIDDRMHPEQFADMLAMEEEMEREGFRMTAQGLEMAGAYSPRCD